MDDMAPPPGSLAARVAQARAQRLREMERRVAEARQFLQLPDDRPSTDDRRQATDEPTSVACRLTPDACGSAPDDSDAFAALRRTFAEPDEAAESGSNATLSSFQDLSPADELRLAQAEIAQLHAQTQRAQEELASSRRRSERDREELGHAARGDAILHMLPIVDDLERALAQVPATLRDDPWVAGLLMIGDSVQRALERQGVERIAPSHAPFDPHLHEAVAHVEATDVAQDTVIQVYRPGYTYNGRVLRAAQVQVAVKKEQ